MLDESATHLGIDQGVDDGAACLGRAVNRLLYLLLTVYVGDDDGRYVHLLELGDGGVDQLLPAGALAAGDDEDRRWTFLPCHISLNRTFPR